MKQLVVTRAGVVVVNLLYILIVALNNFRARRGEDVKAYLAMTSKGEFQSFSETGGCFCSLDGDALMVRIKGKKWTWFTLAEDHLRFASLQQKETSTQSFQFLLPVVRSCS